MLNQIKDIKEKLGNDLLILAHHYQKDEIINIADAVGDSLKLAQIAEQNKTAKYIVFCGVHFMAETADILTEDYQTVIMPDTNAGCDMADMADIDQTETAWEILSKDFSGKMVPITYINSKASIKSFCGKNGGTTVTSSNAENVLKWAYGQKDIVFFLPDQNLGKNTAFDLGITPDETAVWNPQTKTLEYSGDKNKIKIILWKGYCHAHHNISEESVKNIKELHPEIKIIVHPECRHEIVKMSDYKGSTEFIINTIKNKDDIKSWAIGTEQNLVNRLKKTYTSKKIYLLDEVSNCKDMSLTNSDSLLKALEDILNGDFKNKITVDKKTAKNAKKALSIMLNL